MAMDADDLNDFKRTNWDLEDGRTISLITPQELHSLADGTELICIDGSSAIVGRDDIDGDTRFGFLAYGLPRAN